MNDHTNPPFADTFHVRFDPAEKAIIATNDQGMVVATLTAPMLQEMSFEEAAELLGLQIVHYMPSAHSLFGNEAGIDQPYDLVRRLRKSLDGIARLLADQPDLPEATRKRLSEMTLTRVLRDSLTEEEKRELCK